MTRLDWWAVGILTGVIGLGVFLGEMLAFWVQGRYLLETLP